MTPPPWEVMYEIIYSVTGGVADCQAKSPVFLPCGCDSRLQVRNGFPVARPSWPCFHGLEARATSRKGNLPTKMNRTLAMQAEKGGILGSNSGEILLISLVKVGIRTFFSVIRMKQGTMKEISHEKARS